MPHLRNRYVLKLIAKRLKFSPVIALQGARQTGKSVLVRDILAKSLKGSKYITFDSHSTADFAQNNPESFLASHQDCNPLIIDEAQKVPPIFDAVKLRVDENRKPGRYLLLGSTEFSHLTKIRESLTGRMGRIRLYPFTMGETHNLPMRDFKMGDLFLHKPRVSRAQLFKHLELGGMPGLFSIRDAAERARQWDDWLKLTCERDVLQMQGVKIDSGLCLAILQQIAKLDEPSAGAIAKSLMRDLRKIKIHLDVLETLFVVQKLSPHRGSAGKPVYTLLDVALANNLGATLHKRLVTLVRTELDSLLAYHDEPFTNMTYFRARGGGTVHFVIENPKELAIIKVLATESLDLRELEILKSLQSQNREKKIHSYALGGERFSLKKEKIEVFPWESIG